MSKGTLGKPLKGPSGIKAGYSGGSKPLKTPVTGYNPTTKLVTSLANGTFATQPGGKTPVLGAGAQAPGPSSQPVDIHDPQYWDAIQQNNYTRDSGLANLAQSDSYANTDASTSLDRVARQYAQARDNASVAANKQGLFYSGTLTKRLGDLDQSQLDSSTDITTHLARALAANQGSRQGLIDQYGDPLVAGSYGIQGSSALVAAAGRHVGDPLGTGSPGVPTTTTAGGGSAASASSPATTQAAAMLLANPGNVAPGWGIQYQGGKPTALQRINQPGGHSKVGLAKGVGVQYDAAGKPLGFVNVSKSGQVTGPYRRK